MASDDDDDDDGGGAGDDHGDDFGDGGGLGDDYGDDDDDRGGDDHGDDFGDDGGFGDDGDDRCGLGDDDFVGAGGDDDDDYHDHNNFPNSTPSLISAPNHHLEWHRALLLTLFKWIFLLQNKWNLRNPLFVTSAGRGKAGMTSSGNSDVIAAVCHVSYCPGEPGLDMSGLCKSLARMHYA